MVGPQLGKQALVDAAVALIAENDVDAVSLNDIKRASGHRNSSAVNYHFGSKEDLVTEMLRQLVMDHDGRRVELLDHLESTTGAPTTRQLIEAAVRPMTDDLGHPEGRRRLTVIAHVISNERYLGHTRDLMASLPGLGRSTAQLHAQLAWLPEPLAEERLVLTTTFGIRAFADQAHLMDSSEPSRPPLDPNTFSENLIDLIEAMLSTGRTTT